MEMKKRKWITSERLSHKFNKLSFLNCYTYESAHHRDKRSEHLRLKYKKRQGHF